MTSPALETIDDEAQLTPEAKAARAAADAREAPQAPPMPAPQVFDPKTLPRRVRLKLWWFRVRLKLVGRFCRSVGIVPVNAQHYHDAMAEFARLLSFLDSSGALEHAPHARSKIGRGVERVLQLLAAGEQLANEASFMKTLATYKHVRGRSESRKRKQKRAQAIFAQVRAQSLLNRGRSALLPIREQQRGVAKSPEKKLAKLHGWMKPIVKPKPPGPPDTPPPPSPNVG